MNILLIGPRASGKSTIGPELARALGRSFVELDELALKSTGSASVREVWDRQGEPAWRAAEAASFEIALKEDGQVIALGGGAPLVPAINAAIALGRRNRQSIAIYLRCDVGELQRRLNAMPGDRPSLTGLDPVLEVGTVLKARESTYLALADLVHETTAATPSASARQIADRLKPLLAPREG